MTIPSTIQQVNSAICAVFEVTEAELASKRTLRRISDARTCGFFFLWQQRGRYFNRGDVGRTYNKDGSTVSCALARHDRLIAQYREYAAKVRAGEMILRPTTKLETQPTTP